MRTPIPIEFATNVPRLNIPTLLINIFAKELHIEFVKYFDINIRIKQLVPISILVFSLSRLLSWCD